MKRTNPITGSLFTQGDTRADGAIFWAYQSRVGSNGFFYETWMQPDKWEQRRQGKVKSQISMAKRKIDYIQSIKVKRGCADCGYNAHYAALQFDHLPGCDKKFGLHEGYRHSYEAIDAEIAKCEVVCANCHSIRTVTRRVELSADLSSIA